RRHTRFSRDWSSDVCSSDLSRPTHKSTVESRVAPGQTREQTIEGTEETAFLVVPLRNGLEQGGAQRRGEGQRQEAREQDRDRQRSEERRVGKECRARGSA